MSFHASFDDEEYVSFCREALSRFSKTAQLMAKMINPILRLLNTLVGAIGFLSIDIGCLDITVIAHSKQRK